MTCPVCGSPLQGRPVGGSYCSMTCWARRACPRPALGLKPTLPPSASRPRDGGSWFWEAWEAASPAGPVGEPPTDRRPELNEFTGEGRCRFCDSYGPVNADSVCRSCADT